MILSDTQARLLADQFTHLNRVIRRSSYPMNVIVGVGLKGMMDSAKFFGFEYRLTPHKVRWTRCPVVPLPKEEVPG
jgi:hypothetical protein